MSDNDLVKAEAMTPDQVKAARALLGWSITRLSVYSDTSYKLVRTFERTGRVVPMKGPERTQKIDAIAVIRATLEAAGVEFIHENGGGVGLRLRKPDP